MKIGPLGTELFHADEHMERQTDTDMTKLTVTFPILGNRLKIIVLFLCYRC